MVVMLNPAISSNRAVVPMKKTNSKSVTSTPAVVSFEGEGSGMKGQNSFWARVARIAKKGTMFLGGAATVAACHKDPLPEPNPSVKPVNELMTNVNKFLYNVGGVDTTVVNAKNLGSYTTNNIPTNSGDPYIGNYTYNPASTEDTVILETASKSGDQTGAGRLKLFMYKDPLEGKKFVGDVYICTNGAYNYVQRSSFSDKTGSFISNVKSVYSSVNNKTYSYGPDGKGKVLVRDLGTAGKDLILEIINIGTKTR